MVTVARMRSSLQEELDRLEGLLREQGDAVGRTIRGSLKALAVESFVARDLDGAQRLVELDELIDRANRRVVGHVLELGGEPAQREWGLHMIVVSRALERIGDHAVDIGEQTAYLITGEFREFT